jgi:hypothetical protein
VEGEEDSANEKRSRYGVVPAQVLAEVEGDEDAKDNEREKDSRRIVWQRKRECWRRTN